MVKGAVNPFDEGWEDVNASRDVDAVALRVVVNTVDVGVCA